ncbi:hypothetical protein BKA70DRAFT_1220441 [Coprinopsis sp. MPI-PUGE-AT-0042]|nr:hypothetical protein BKA70DRAFT_1220441 [Coprinopsis sp. MPI-PUGE-AT-0042]
MAGAIEDGGPSQAILRVISQWNILPNPGQGFKSERNIRHTSASTSQHQQPSRAKQCFSHGRGQVTTTRTMQTSEPTIKLPTERLSSSEPHSSLSERMLWRMRERGEGGREGGRPFMELVAFTNKDQHSDVVSWFQGFERYSSTVGVFRVERESWKEVIGSSGTSKSSRDDCAMGEAKAQNTTKIAVMTEETAVLEDLRQICRIENGSQDVLEAISKVVQRTENVEKGRRSLRKLEEQPVRKDE